MKISMLPAVTTEYSAAVAQLPEIVVTEPREPIGDLDSLPIVNRTYISHSEYFQYISQTNVKYCISLLLATRGCPYACAYCESVAREHRARSSDNVFEEIQLYYDAGIYRFAIVE